MKTYILYWGKKIYNRYNDKRTALFMFNAIVRDYGPMEIGALRLFETDGIHQAQLIKTT